MHHDKTFLSIIPARGGSKRLPRKNILDLAGKPLIAWSIEAAKSSKYIDEVMVTTDDKEIAKVSVRYGAKVPFFRPEVLATDIASTFDVIEHTIDFYKNDLKKEFDYLVLLQPTSPLRKKTHIDEAIALMVAKNADAVISVCEVDHSPLWSNTLPENGDLSHFIREEIKGIRSQDLPKYYRLNGAIYICRIQRLLEEKTLFIKDNIFAYQMDRKASVDIDEALDLIMAKAIIDTNKL